MQMQAWFAESSRGLSCDSQTYIHQLNSWQEFKLWMKPPSSHAGAACLVSCTWGRGSVEETSSLFPAVQHACLKFKSPKEESKISCLIQGQKKKRGGKAGKSQIWVLNGRGTAVAAVRGSGGVGMGRNQEYNSESPPGISSVDCTVICKNWLWLLHSCLLLIVLFHMRPNMFFHRYADFKLFCLDLPVEGLQLTQRVYQ